MPKGPYPYTTRSFGETQNMKLSATCKEMWSKIGSTRASYGDPMGTLEFCGYGLTVFYNGSEDEPLVNLSKEDAVVLQIVDVLGKNKKPVDFAEVRLLVKRALGPYITGTAPLPNVAGMGHG